MKTLEKIEIFVPEAGSSVGVDLLQFLKNFGQLNKKSVEFSKSNKDFTPKISVGLTGKKTPYIQFDGNNKISIELINSTGQNKQSPHKYSHIPIREFIKRIKNLNINYLDHIGFDLPWFEGVHPQITKLRSNLPKECLYFLYPTGENWDFIIPATEDEILSKEINYKAIRRPKFEIVSIDKVSTPIIQFDFSVAQKYEEIKKLFPEGITDDCLKNVWVYIENPYNIDICFVVGQSKKTDWYRYLRKGLVK